MTAGSLTDFPAFALVLFGVAYAAHFYHFANFSNGKILGFRAMLETPIIRD